jgi:hypothetical protein
MTTASKQSLGFLLPLVATLLVLGNESDCHAQERGDNKPAGASALFDGSLLITPIKSRETLLVNGAGEDIHIWKSDYEAAAGARLMPDGRILRIAVEPLAKTFRTTGLAGGRIQILGWEGQPIWNFWNAAVQHMVCGDALILPNGNVLMAVAEYKSNEDVIALGRDRDRVTFEGLYAPGLMEFAPNGENGGRLVWRWSAWDHVYQDRHPEKPGYETTTQELLDRWNINANALRGFVISEIAYDETSDLLMITMPSLGEAWLLDHSTSTAEAVRDRGGRQEHGGRLLMRYRGVNQMPGQVETSVLSASFESGTSAELPAITTLTKRGLGNDVGYSIDRILLSVVGADDKGRLQKPTANIRGQWTEKTDSVQPSVPTSWTPGPKDSSFVARRKIGRVDWIRSVSSGSNSEWSYRNARGLTVVVQSPTNPDAEQCCGGAQPLRENEQKLSGVRVPLMGTPRYYAEDYLQRATSIERQETR